MNRKKTIVMLALVFLVVSKQDASAPHHIHHYFWANYQQLNKDARETNRWYKKLLSTNPPTSVYKGYLTFLSALGAHKYVVQFIPKLDTYFKDDLEIQTIFAHALEKVGKIKDSYERFMTLNKKDPSNPTIAFQTAQIYQNLKEPENALHTIDTLLNKSGNKPNNFVFHFLKAQIYIQLQQKDKALESVTESLNMHSYFDKGWLLFALLQEQKGQLSEAITGYTNFLEITTDANPMIQQHLLQLIYKQKIVQKNPNATVAINQSCFSQALSLFEKKEYTTGLTKINQCLDKEPTNPEARLLKIQLLSALNKPIQAAETITEWIMKKPSDPEWYNALHLLYNSDVKVEKIIILMQRVINTHPNALHAHVTLADAAMRTNQVKTALTHYTTAETLTNDPLLKTKLLFTIGRIYYTQSDHEQMVQTLQKGLDLKQDYPPLLNLLAYHYATQKRDLTHAQELIERALKQSKNPHFLDTQALVFYKQKKYRKALAILEEANKQLPQDFTIYKHLAKTYYKLGKKTAALTTIKKGQPFAQHSYEKDKANFMIKQWEKDNHEH